MASCTHQISERREVASPRDVFAAGARAVRKARGWTQEDVARRVAELGGKLHFATLSKVEAGTRGVSLDEALLLAAALQVSAGKLISGEAAATHGQEQAVQVADQLTLNRHQMREWLCGQIYIKLDSTSDDPALRDVMPDENWAMTMGVYVESIVGRVQDLLEAIDRELLEDGDELPADTAKALEAVQAQLGKLRMFESREGRATPHGRQFEVR
jgi:transcriptional regulator with XRE-family HTH domain